jgi:hypothetical protein
VNVAELERENLERVLAGKGEPKILVGSINLGAFPNFHTLPMIEMGASLVSIQPEPTRGRADLLYCSPCENLASVLDRLPPNWKPDFFLDLQAEHGHWLPVGLAELPFPTVVTVNHAHFGQVLHHMQGLFDCMVMPSPMMEGWGTDWLPWSGSWGAMDDRIALLDATYKGEEKDVTVVCPMSVSGAAKESVRHAVIDEMRRIKERRADWTVEIATGLNQAEYFKLLARSKVVVNVGTWGSPVSYRPFETVAQGAILVHVDESAYGSTAKLSEVFEERWFVAAEPGGMESAIEHALDRHPLAATIKTEVDERYSYRAQYTRLFEIAAKTEHEPKISLRHWSRRAHAIGHLTGFHELAALHAWALTPADVRSKTHYPGNGWDVCLWAPADPEERYRWQTEIALRQRPIQDIYEEYACAR